ncbi:MAG TPA: MFS transporter [Caulobacteraceae bacterium]|jgi:GPH family glycoside/pentoside/hexuronide:cation symporter|nr:MFS transporter [Caulobacteraceae bacterium]
MTVAESSAPSAQMVEAKAAASVASPPLRLTDKLFYGLGSVAFGVKDNGFSYLLLLFYNQVVGLSAPLVGLAIMIAMIFDAFLDPIVGQISDNWRSRWGRRHPFMYTAAAPVALSYLALWNPPHGWSTPALFFYLVVVAIVIRTFITFYEVPSSALSAELTQGYDERTVLLSYRYFFGWVGGLLLYLITFSFLLVPDAHHKVGQTNPVGFSRYGMLASVIMFTAILISSVGTQKRAAAFPPPPRRRLSLLETLKEMIATWSNRSFLFLTLSGLATSMAAGLGASMNIYFNTYFWEFSSRQIATLVAGVFVSAFLALFAAAPLSRWLGKRAAAISLIVASVLIGICPMLLRLAGLMPPNHSPALFVIIFGQAIVSVALGIAGTTLISAMIADVVEDGELKTGRRSEGLFFSASSLVAKAVSGVGIFAASLILSAIHFPAGAKPGHVPAGVIRDLALVYAPIVLGLYAAGLLLMRGYRITRASHAETLERLAARAGGDKEVVRVA